MKYIPLLLLLSACAQIHPETPASRVASSLSVPHKMEPYGCGKYTLAVTPRLKAAGAKNVHSIFFRTSSGQVHGVVSYRDTDGEWFVDNEHVGPVTVFGKDDQEKLSCWMTKTLGMQDTTTADIIR